MSKHLILIGFMGTGKTTVGEHIHREINLPWIDTDEYLENKWGMSVVDYFLKYGEASFRQEETQLLQKLVVCSSSPYIISTGGGMVVRSENRKMIFDHGTVVCLTAEIDDIIYRLSGDKQRPLLKGNSEESLRSLYSKRCGVYDFADLVLDTSRLSVSSVVDEVAWFWKKITK